MSVKQLQRVFKIKVNGNIVTLKDPNDELSIEEVQEVYCQQYPQLLNASAVEKGINDSDQMEIEFVTVAGTKG